MVLFVFLFSACKFRQQADLLVHHAHIYTTDSNFSVVQAMAIRDGKIIATGTNEEIMKDYEGKESVDAAGKSIFPGLIDAHCHFAGFATDMWKVELTGTNSFEEVIEKINQYAPTAPMEWIYGRGWDQNDWAVKEYPDKKILDSLFPNRPVFLKRIDGHAALVNQKAFDLAGVTDQSTVAGGSFEKKDGRLTGIIIDNAMDMIDNVVPAVSDSLAKVNFIKAQQLCFAVGLTGVHDCGVSEHTINLLDEAQKNGGLRMKIFALLTDSAHYYDKWLASGQYKTPYLHVGGFKVYADGALGSRGACLLKDYADKPGWTGFLLNDSTHYALIANKLAGSDFQMCTHAIGDSGNRTILKEYARVLKGKNDRRWRIEHAQVVNENDFHYFQDYNIIPSVQPTHATSDMYWAGQRLGPDRVKNAYAFKKLMQTNSWIPLGTDFPVEDISPLKTFYAAVVRTDASGYPQGGYQMENALSRQEALRGMTTWAARAAFEEKEKGSLEKGMAADFIMVDTDIMQCQPADILKTKVLATYINGQKVH